MWKGDKWTVVFEVNGIECGEHSTDDLHELRTLVYQAFNNNKDVVAHIRGWPHGDEFHLDTMDEVDGHITWLRREMVRALREGREVWPSRAALAYSPVEGWKFKPLSSAHRGKITDLDLVGYEYVRDAHVLFVFDAESGETVCLKHRSGVLWCWERERRLMDALQHMEKAHARIIGVMHGSPETNIPTSISQDMAQVLATKLRLDLVPCSIRKAMDQEAKKVLAEMREKSLFVKPIRPMDHSCHGDRVFKKVAKVGGEAIKEMLEAPSPKKAAALGKPGVDLVPVSDTVVKVVPQKVGSEGNTPVVEHVKELLQETTRSIINADYEKHEVRVLALMLQNLGLDEWYHELVDLIRHPEVDDFCWIRDQLLKHLDDERITRLVGVANDAQVASKDGPEDPK